jgi:hypothetical protein
MPWRRRHDLAVQVTEAVLAIDLAVADGVPEPPVALAAERPFVFGKQRVYVVVNEGEPTLG